MAGLDRSLGGNADKALREQQQHTEAGDPHGQAAADKAGVHSGRILVRLAQSQDDIAAMIALGRQLHAESRFRTLALDDARMAEIGRRGLAGNPGLLMAERDGELVGMAIVILGEYFFSTARTATVQLLYVHPKARGGPAAVKLLRALRRWAASNGATDLHVNVTTGIQAARTDRFLRRMGFRQTGGNYVLEGVEAKVTALEGATPCGVNGL